MEYKPLSELAKDEESCGKLFKLAFPAPLSRVESVHENEFAIMIEGDNGDMNPDYARLEIHFDGSVYCCISVRSSEIDIGINSIFKFVDTCRSLGYSA